MATALNLLFSLMAIARFEAYFKAVYRVEALHLLGGEAEAAVHKQAYYLIFIVGVACIGSEGESVVFTFVCLAVCKCQHTAYCPFLAQVISYFRFQFEESGVEVVVVP